MACSQETDNPDLRDRAFIYWRLLSTDPEAARAVVLAEKPVIVDTSASLEPSLLSTLLANLSTLASVYHKPPEVRQGWELGKQVQAQNQGVHIHYILSLSGQPRAQHGL